MRETVDPDFASFVDARQGRWLRTAYLVYGDVHRAEQLLLHAFTHLSVRWPRVDDPDAFDVSTCHVQPRDLMVSQG